MALNIIKCSQCGANLENTDEKSLSCQYCGSVFDKPNTEKTTIINNHTTVINNVSNNNSNRPVVSKGKRKDKWAALILCILFGYFGAHKFYEGKNSMGLIYIFTVGLFGFGWFIDIFVIALKPNPYYV